MWEVIKRKGTKEAVLFTGSWSDAFAAYTAESAKWNATDDTGAFLYPDTRISIRKE